MSLVSVSAYTLIVKTPCREVAVITKEGCGIDLREQTLKSLHRCNLTTRQFIRHAVTLFRV